MIDEIISTKIKIKSKEPEKLKKLLDLEIKRKKYKRSDSKISIKDNYLVIDVFAQDIIAFKATVNNYINLLELIKKTYEVKL